MKLDYSLRNRIKGLTNRRANNPAQYGKTKIEGKTPKITKDDEYYKFGRELRLSVRSQ